VGATVWFLTRIHRATDLVVAAFDQPETETVRAGVVSRAAQSVFTGRPIVHRSVGTLGAIFMAQVVGAFICIVACGSLLLAANDVPMNAATIKVNATDVLATSVNSARVIIIAQRVVHNGVTPCLVITRVNGTVNTIIADQALARLTARVCGTHFHTCADTSIVAQRIVDHVQASARLLAAIQGAVHLVVTSIRRADALAGLAAVLDGAR